MKHEYVKLKIWSKSRDLTKEVYLLSRGFPATEDYGLTSQIRRCAVSIPSNIAEGSAFESSAQFVKYLRVALGSLCELETQLYLAEDLKYIKQTESQKVLEEADHLKRMIISFKNNLK